MSLDEIKKDRTVIIISHSISQIIDAANIIVMEKGTVAESGTHETLYDSKGVYYDIFTAMANSLNIEKIKMSMEDWNKKIATGQQIPLNALWSIQHPILNLEK